MKMTDFRFTTKGAESEQPVGALLYQWVGCRDHAGIACFPHSRRWQAQGGPANICRDQRKRVFHNMGPLKLLTRFLWRVYKYSLSFLD